MSVSTAAILGCLGPELTADEAAFFREADPWGFILFARNVETPEQLRRLTGDLRAAVGREAPVLADQEGGRVQRLRGPIWQDWPPPLDQAEAGGARALRLSALGIAAELRSVGIDVNCAPVLDIVGPDTHPFLRNRCYGSDLERVLAGAHAVVEGLVAGGVLPVMKHMPGHGRANADTHLNLPVVTTRRAELQATDFAAFAEFSDLSMAMTAHIVFSAIDPDRPATQSPEVIRLIREDIGFGGLLISDDLNMEALSGSLGQRAAASIAAGCDLALQCNGIRAEMEAVVAASGRMRPEAVARAEAALAARRAPEDVDMDRLRAEFDAVMSGQSYG